MPGRTARHVDDPALPRVEHRRDHLLGQVQWGVHVHLEHHLAAAERQRREGAVERRRSVVHEHLDVAAQSGDGIGHDTSPVIRVGQVRGDHRDAPAVASDPPSGLGQAAAERPAGFRRASDHRHMGPFGSQTLAGRRADATARPGHEHATALEAPQPVAR